MTKQPPSISRSPAAECLTFSAASGELIENSVIQDFQITATYGKISHDQAKLHAETEFEKYRVVQDQLYASDFDRFLEEQAASYAVPAETNMSADKGLTDLIKETGHAGA